MKPLNAIALAGVLCFSGLTGCMTLRPADMLVNPAEVQFTPTTQLTAPKEFAWRLQEAAVSTKYVPNVIYVPGINGASGTTISTTAPLSNAALFGPTDQQATGQLLRSALTTAGFTEHPQAHCHATLSFNDTDTRVEFGYGYTANIQLTVTAPKGKELWTKHYRLDSHPGKSQWRPITNSEQEGKHLLIRQLLAVATNDLVAWGNEAGNQCAAGENRRPPALPPGPIPVTAGPIRIGRITDTPEYKPGCLEEKALQKTKGQKEEPSIVGTALALFDCRNPDYDKLLKYPLTVDDARRDLQGTTRRNFTQAHGNQISYLAEDGRIYLWYPGNTRVMQGEWTVLDQGALLPLAHPELKALLARSFGRPATADASEDVGFVCFRYRSEAFNPATGSTGGGWECVNASEYIRGGTKEALAGDLFGLAELQQVPRVIPNDSRDEEDFKTLLTARRIE